MSLVVSQKKDWVFLLFSGRMDSFTYEFLTNQLNILFRMGKRKILIDLSETKFINFNTLRFLSQFSFQLKSQNGQLRLLCPQDELKINVFAFNSLRGIVFNSIDDAFRNDR